MLLAVLLALEGPCSAAAKQLGYAVLLSEGPDKPNAAGKTVAWGSYHVTITGKAALACFCEGHEAAGVSLYPSPARRPHRASRTNPAAGYLPCQGGYSTCDKPGKAGTCPSLHTMVKLAGQAWKVANGVRTSAMLENAMQALLLGWREPQPAAAAGSRRQQAAARCTDHAFCAVRLVCLPAGLVGQGELQSAWHLALHQAVGRGQGEGGAAASMSSLIGVSLRLVASFRCPCFARACCPSFATRPGASLAGQNIRCCPAAQRDARHPGQGEQATRLGGCAAGVQQEAYMVAEQLAAASPLKH